jgi:hypothetical protein
MEHYSHLVPAVATQELILGKPWACGVESVGRLAITVV